MEKKTVVDFSQTQVKPITNKQLIRAGVKPHPPVAMRTIIHCATCGVKFPRTTLLHGECIWCRLR